jgi:phage FluMu gp28-like protein
VAVSEVKQLTSNCTRRTKDEGQRTSANPQSDIETRKSKLETGGPPIANRQSAIGNSQSAINLLPYQRRWVEDDSPLKIVVKARQIGYSFAATLRAVFKCLERRTTWVFLSKGERQSRLLMEKVHDHIRACGIVARRAESTYFEGTSLKQLEVRFPNGSVIYGLPANPDTARGYSGHVTLDEFAFHADADKIYAALFPTITRGYGLEVISTPNGTQGKFYELAKAAGLEERKWEVGSRKSGEPYSLLPTSYPRPSLAWSAHLCDIYDAVRQGLKIDLALLRTGCEDESAWQQEFCCQFVSTAENFIPPELLASCLSAEATTDSPLFRQTPLLTGLGPASAPRTGTTGFRSQVSEAGEEQKPFVPDTRRPAPDTCFFLGIDIGRRHDRTVFWLDEVQVPGVGFQVPGLLPDTRHPTPDTSLSITSLVRTMANAPFADQLAFARELLSLADESRRPLIRRACIDATGLGAMLAETLQKEFGPRVEPVVFTAALKEDLAFRTKRRMEAGLTLLPDTREIRRAFSAVKRFVTPSGNLRFDAARTEAGHADEFWAKALADLAADESARRLATVAEAFLAEAVPIVNPAAFGVREANWSEWVM